MNQTPVDIIVGNISIVNKTCIWGLSLMYSNVGITVIDTYEIKHINSI